MPIDRFLIPERATRKLHVPASEGEFYDRNIVFELVASAYGADSVDGTGEHWFATVLGADEDVQKLLVGEYGAIGLGDFVDAVTEDVQTTKRR